MGDLHSLLSRQLRRLLGQDAETPKEWLPLLELVNATYCQSDVDRSALEQSLHLSSEELLQVTSEVRALVSALPDLTARLSEDGYILNILSQGQLPLAPLSTGQHLKAMFAPQSQSVIEEALEAACETPAPGAAIVDYEADGHRQACEVRLRRVPSGQFLVLVREVTELLRSKRDLEKALALLRGTLDSTGEGFLVADTYGNVIVFNEKLLEIFELERNTKPDELLGRIVERVESEEQDHDLLLQRLALAGHRDAREDFTLTLRSGRTVSCHLRPQAIQASTSGQIWCFRDTSERTRAEHEIRHQAMHDSLTGLANRAHFYERLTDVLNDAKRRNRAVALLYVDLDRFKSINDSLGHGAGDELLRQMGNRLRSRTRSSDLVCRLGGDEFTVIVQNIRDPGDASKVARHLQEVLNGTYELHGQSVYVSGSIGVAVFPEDAEDAEQLVRKADAALYRAKAKGRSQYCLSRDDGQADSYDALLLENRMRRAIDDEEFVLHYQPQLDMRTGHVVGVEALLRWPQDDGSLLSPARFIPLAEESGLIVPLGYWVLERAFRDTLELRSRNPDLRVAVNLSPRQLMDERLVSNVEALLEAHPIKPRNLVLELTENGILPNPDQAHRTLKSFRDLGVRVALDDFGTGQSSLSHLSLLPIDVVKIDRSFVKDCWTVEASGAIVSAILSICRARKLSVVAEGIEEEEEEAFLLSRECIYGQGFRYKKPAPIQEIEIFVAERAAIDLRSKEPLSKSSDLLN